MSEDTKTCLSILVVDDDEGVRRTVSNYLRARKHNVLLASRGEEALQALDGQVVDLVITDLKMPGMSGLEVLAEVKQRSHATEVIVITAYGDIESAVTAIKDGASDFLRKPVKVEELDAAISRTARVQQLQRQNERFRERLSQVDSEARARYGLHAIVGESDAIREVKRQITRIAETDDTTVLITGETGTGKELVAHAVHVESRRSEGPFVAVDCSAIPGNLIEAEFYGHEKGAYTDAKGARKGHFERADGGTLFLDEIGDMPLEMQVKLLRTLESRRIRRLGGDSELPVDVRVVSATHHDLSSLVTEGRFREDLVYRLNTFSIHIPPLRDRPDDILPVADYFLPLYSHRLRKNLTSFDSEAASLLRSHPFPGNIRELRNLVERAVILCETEKICVSDLRFGSGTTDVDIHAEDPPGNSAIQSSDSSDMNLNSLERDTIQKALRLTDGNREQASQILGISRHALRRRMKAHSLEFPS